MSAPTAEASDQSTNQRINESTPIGEASAAALEQAVITLLSEDWDPPSGGLIAPDLVLDFAGQYVVNTRRVQMHWVPDDLVAEYLRQMAAENWATVRRVAPTPRRGSRSTRRLYLALLASLARHRDRPIGQGRSLLLVLGAYLRGALQVGDAAVHPLTVPLRHRALRRLRVDPNDPWGGRVTRAMLRRVVEGGGLRHGPSLLHGYRLALIGVAVAHRGAVALANARGESAVDRGSLEQALEAVEQQLLAGGQLWKIVSNSSLGKDITLRLLGRRAAVPTLIGL